MTLRKLNDHRFHCTMVCFGHLRQQCSARPPFGNEGVTLRELNDRYPRRWMKGQEFKDSQPPS